jgi:CHAT domain-containing protein
MLHDWIMKPVEPELGASGINTLVFVPDGALRTIPMAALYNGSQFLIEKYAVAVTPGLSLTDPRPINRETVKLLSAGLSDSVQGFPALPNVTKELESIQQIYGGKQLLNDQFKISRVEGELKEQPFTILHIASHGTVEKDVNNSFILAYDGKITMDRLGELVGLYKYRNTPLELLTLSACETAAGDDQAALGLAGVAVKAGARSALATLWFIDDAATSDLVTEFYLQLQNPAQSKARALQRAQLSILKDPARQHPSYWAPFLLINNWL